MGSLFKPKPQVRCSHILVESEAEAKALLKRLQEGGDFTKEARALSKCPSGQNGGDLGRFPRGKMVKEFDAVAFDLEVGELSGLVKTQFGYHVLKRTE